MFASVLMDVVLLVREIVGSGGDCREGGREGGRAHVISDCVCVDCMSPESPRCSTFIHESCSSGRAVHIKPYYC